MWEMGYTSDGCQTRDDEVTYRLEKPNLGQKNEERRFQQKVQDLRSPRRNCNHLEEATTTEKDAAVARDAAQAGRESEE